MSDYVSRLQHNTCLDEPVSEGILVKTISKHFVTRIRNKLHVTAILTIEELISQLDEIELKDKQAAEERAKYATNRAIPVATYRSFSTLPRMNTNYQRSQPRTFAARAAGQNITRQESTRQETTRRPVQFIKARTAPRGKTPVARSYTGTNDQSKDTRGRATNVDHDKNVRSGSNERQTSKMTLRKRDVRQKSQERSAYGSSWCSEIKTSNKQKKTGQESFRPITRSVSVVIKVDGRYYTPVKLITQGVEWPTTIFCDTGATNSIIREDVWLCKY